jgi:hypothetical protein
MRNAKMGCFGEKERSSSRQVLECARPLALSNGSQTGKAAEGRTHSRTLPRLTGSLVSLHANLFARSRCIGKAFEMYV